MKGAPDAYFAGSIPAIYDRYLGPLLFQPYAEDLASRVADLKQGSLLELAAGTGVVTSELASALPQEVELVATDLNEAMLRVSEQKLAGGRARFQQADAQQLPFEDQRFEVVVSQFGVMFLPDKRAGYREARRVLKNGGRYVFNVWNRVEENEVTAITGAVLARLFPESPPQFMRRTPFGYFDANVIRADVESAGFRRIDIEVVDKVSRGTAEQAAIGLCQGTPLRSEIEQRDATRLEEATAAVRVELAARFGPGTFDNRMSALVVTAWQD
jgi:ubiquinone/menaquinone biosynthesis C-methylase UbiE